MSVRSTFCLLMLGAAVLASGCDDDPPAGDPDAGEVVECAVPRSQRYLPFAIGASWTYDVSEPDIAAVAKINTVEAFEDVGDVKAGVMAFRLRTEKTNGYTLSWQADLCTSIVRHREQSFELVGTLETDQFFVPSKLRIDETAAHVAVGAHWSVSYTEVEHDPVEGPKTISKDEAWSVVAVDVPVTVPAGTFSTLQLRKTTSGAADKMFWFAAGVGKIKEQGEQLEELRAFTLP